MAFIIPGVVSLAFGIGLSWHIFSNHISLKNVQSDKFSQNPEKSDYFKIIIIMLVSITSLGFVFQILQTSLPKIIDIRLTESLGLDTFNIGVIIAFIYIISGLMNYAGGILADSYSEKLIYVSGILGQSILFFFLANFFSYWLIIFAFMIVAVNSSILPAENILLARIAPSQYQSLVYGIKFIISFSIGPLAVFLISKSYEMTQDFYFLYLISGVMLLFLFPLVASLPIKRKMS